MRQGKRNSAGDMTSAATAPALDPAALEHLLTQDPTPQRFCGELSRVFQVQQDEVALLRLEQGSLKFLFPDELQTVGSIPLSPGSSVAAHTAVTKKVELFNSFVKVKHASIFESVKLANQKEGVPQESAAIQKLMSAPVLDRENKVLGVLQVCRKGIDVSSSGPDFTLDDLQQLEIAAKLAAKLPFMREDATGR
jgi:hypothetical protein